ncbi:MAG: dicarboxylate/amino acid:cation symporter [Pirellulaceae bacterium]|jgi:Na+/H+-dicarboxylate symporter|nr:dicarboxylate/amino acid:cation symporter [Pirellulaceae bacterium]MDP6720886.1 dicarboxylate/amino acid:cation symporter [Pirellulaceae bacterium]
MSEKKSHLTLYICIAIVAAIGLALGAPHFAMKFHIGGEIFLRLLKMMVVPLVVTSVMSGILGLGDVRKLGKPGGLAVLYYFCTTILAVVVGLAVVNVIRPGVGTVDQATLDRFENAGNANAPKARMLKKLSDVTGMTEDEVGSVFRELPSGEPETPSVSKILENLVLMLVTDNLLHSAVETNLLPLIVFSILFAGMLTTMGKNVDVINNLVTQSSAALMAFIMLLMKLAPIGIFCLVTARFGEARAEGRFIQEMTQIGWYFATVIAGLAIHVFATLPLIYWIILKKNPYRFMFQMSQALLTAFSTASSSATLPVTMETAQQAGVAKKSVDFVLPLGATINMDGTALYEAAAAIFIAQAIGFDLSLAQQVIIAVTATLAAIGAAGIPEAGLVTMLIVLNAVGLPIEYVGLILSVDWLLDRFRTAANTFGDCIGAAVVEKAMPSDGG